MVDKIPTDNTKLIMLYLQWFVKRHADVLQKEWISIDPYAYYQTQYAEALENTSTVQDNKIPQKISYEERQKYDFHYIGKYYMSTGSEYDVAEMTIGWKKYFYARSVDEDKDTYHIEEWLDIKLVNYYLSRGKEVVKIYKQRQKIIHDTSDAIAKNIDITPKPLQTTKPDSKPKWFTPWISKR